MENASTAEKASSLFPLELYDFKGLLWRGDNLAIRLKGKKGSGGS